MSKIIEKIIVTETENSPTIIRGRDFKIEQIDEEAPMWDLYLMKGKNPKLVLEGYGYPIEVILTKLFQYRKSKGSFITKRIYSQIKDALWKPRLKLRNL